MSKSVVLIFNGLIFVVILVVVMGLVIYLLLLIIRALRKYLKSGQVREEKKEYKKSLGEVLKAHRTACHMTQEFVSESLGVTRQAVSKWENGTSDPSTSNLLALAKLYGVNADELLRQMNPEKSSN
jgi:DNA-binding XRE family transcriptional regulator